MHSDSKCDMLTYQFNWRLISIQFFQNATKIFSRLNGGIFFLPCIYPQFYLDE